MQDTQTERIFFPAHIRQDSIQSCQDHCLNTASYAKQDLKNIGMGDIAYLAGLLHDCGKFSNDFKEYIENSFRGKDVIKGSVIHSFAGVYYILTRFHDRTADKPYERLTSELIAQSIGSHHGLFDCINEDRKNGFEYRLNKQPLYEKEAISNFEKYFCKEDIINRLFKEATKAVEELISKVSTIAADNQELYFYIGLISRMISSAVIDGDRRDTAEFMASADFNSCVQATPKLWKECLTNLELFLGAFPCETSIQHARNEISNLCATFATNPGGIYRLNVPTGGGKTLSSLRYALIHAARFEKKRIIYTAPLISILEQNARVIRDGIGSDDVILEHHSNLLRSEMTGDELNRYDLLAQTWDAPIIITTLVQLLNTLFSGKTSCVRRFQSLCDSIIIIDEVHTVPIKMLTLFNLTINFLSSICGATIVLCSATQPCFDQAGKHRMLISKENILSAEEYERYNEVFKRTEIKDGGSYTLEEISTQAESLFESVRSLLIICNTKSEASKLFNNLHHSCQTCYHLSASMCMSHRKNVLEQVNSELEANRKVVLIATQVVEAGVDISFEAVIRLTAGMDNIVQAAGRCNRNGEKEGLSPVFVVRCIDEILGNLKDISRAQDASNNLLGAFSSEPERFNNDLSSDESIDYYYRSLYNSAPENLFDFPIEHNTLFDILSENLVYSDGGERVQDYVMHQAFKMAGDKFEVIDRDAEAVIVPYDKGVELIAELLTERARYDLTYAKYLLDQAKDYSVTVYSNQLERLIREGGVIPVMEGKLLVLQDDWYSKHTGLSTEQIEKEDNECNILIS